jgi:hypothetical protein
MRFRKENAGGKIFSDILFLNMSIKYAEIPPTFL